MSSSSSSPRFGSAFASAVVPVLKGMALALPVGVLAGSASALFLWALERVTELRWQHGWLLWWLPVAGVALGWIYHRFGRSAEGGNNLLIDAIHAEGDGVPVRMAPLVLGGTLLTHLFGGSAGREGTAVQMGGSLAAALGRVLRLKGDALRGLLLAGVAAGFGSIFGTPLTGAIFALEVLVIGRIRHQAFLPVLVASLVGDATCSAWGIVHTSYHIEMSDGLGLHAKLDAVLLAKVVGASVVFGLVSRGFAELTHGLQERLKKILPSPLLRPAAGGALVIALTLALGTRDYLGLGVHAPAPGAVTLVSAFSPGGAETWSWAWKILFTVITLASGFKGGEVTPLFFIGATLGNTLAGLLGVPVDLFAGLGLLAVFAGATNTPLACTVMGLELFGAHYAVYFAVACFVAYYASGHSGIYPSQRIGRPKHPWAGLTPGLTLREVRKR